MGQKKRAEIICRCNNISRDTVESAIREGAQSMNEIFDATTAGVGSCGGTCRRKLQPLLDHYLQHGVFPEKICENLIGKIFCKPKCDEDEGSESGTGSGDTSGC